jgi:hypothetical protein
MARSLRLGIATHAALSQSHLPSHPRQTPYAARLFIWWGQVSCAAPSPRKWHTPTPRPPVRLSLASSRQAAPTPAANTSWPDPMRASLAAGAALPAVDDAGPLGKRLKSWVACAGIALGARSDRLMLRSRHWFVRKGSRHGRHHRLVHHGASTGMGQHPLAAGFPK